MNQHPGEKSKLSSCVIITFQVMAFARVSAGDPYPVCPFPQGRENKFGAHSASTGDADNPDIGGVLHPANTCKICGPVTTGVT